MSLNAEMEKPLNCEEGSSNNNDNKQETSMCNTETSFTCSVEENQGITSDSGVEDEKTQAILALRDVIFKQQATMEQSSQDNTRKQKELKKLSKKNRMLREELKLAKKELKRRKPVPANRAKSFVAVLLQLNDMRKREKKCLS
jgi:hypothetical protein